MIKLLVLSGSPVEQSSTELILQSLSENIADEVGGGLVKTRFVRLNDLTVKPCQACGKAPHESYCFYDDGMTDLYKDVAECDCLLFGTPIYFDTVSAQAKLFIDRCNCFRPPDFDNEDPDHLFLKRLKRKRPGAMVLVGGEETWYEGARRTVAGFFKWIEVQSCGLICYGSPDYNHKGTAMQSDEVVKQIAALTIEISTKLKEDYARPQ